MSNHYQGEALVDEMSCHGPNMLYDCGKKGKGALVECIDSVYWVLT